MLSLKIKKKIYCMWTIKVLYFKILYQTISNIVNNYVCTNKNNHPHGCAGQNLVSL